ncbi:hypothetical protein QLX08_000299 [Tetragonisca angustula]|uniref:Uncharacterized protein n=1 Tax=Tetragonisca angustula TaxID=166442 RepID=A0AAW1ALY4_9HYME
MSVPLHRLIRLLCNSPSTYMRMYFLLALTNSSFLRMPMAIVLRIFGLKFSKVSRTQFRSHSTFTLRGDFNLSEREFLKKLQQTLTLSSRMLMKYSCASI